MTPAPLELHREAVLPEWTDYNGHMNVAFYLLAFDHATDAFFDHLDLGHAYRKRTDCSLFTLEAHVSYAKELNEGDPLRFRPSSSPSTRSACITSTGCITRARAISPRPTSS